MQAIKTVLSSLEHCYQENSNEYISESEIYEFIIEKIDYKGISDTLCYYFMRLAAASIAEELIKQDKYGSPKFNKAQIFDLLVDYNNNDYLQIYRHYFGETGFLEQHIIDGENYFFGEGLKIRYDDFIKIFSLILTQELNTALEKVKNILNSKVDVIDWLDLIVGGNGDYLDIEKERIDEIVKGVLK